MQNTVKTPPGGGRIISFNGDIIAQRSAKVNRQSAHLTHILQRQNSPLNLHKSRKYQAA